MGTEQPGGCGGPVDVALPRDVFCSASCLLRCACYMTIRGVSLSPIDDGSECKFVCGLVRTGAG